jgi:hypothetical protein
MKGSVVFHQTAIHAQLGMARDDLSLLENYRAHPKTRFCTLAS